jgi:uncharacterized protein YbbC (DUF1343 family)
MKYSNDTLELLLYQKYVKLLGLVLFFVFLLFSCQSHQEPDKTKLVYSSLDIPTDSSVILGIGRMDTLIALIDGRTVAVVGNQTSVVNDSIHLVDTLLSRKVNIVKVFSPEHGFRGTGSAGQKIDNSIDAKTRIPIISLYGAHKKPTKFDLQGVDFVIFDIQDVGVRFYTYISTLHYVMEACAESNISLLVLDRPNPNGDYIDGPVLELKHRSFVGMHPVPVVHGMTIGEYALMVNGEKWLKDQKKCDLTVLTCLNYQHDMRYILPIPPSPNLRSEISVRLYPSLCFFEGTTVSVGRGTDQPFELYGHPELDPTDFNFTPKSQMGAIYPKHQNISCGGVYLGEEPINSRFSLDYLMAAINELGDPVSVINRKKFFILLSGTEKLYRQILAGSSEDEIRQTWQPDLEKFKQIRAKYLCYD